MKQQSTSTISTLIALLFFFGSTTIYAQGIGINSTNTPAHPSAMLDVDATDRGVLIPRLTTAQRNAISNPAYGLIILNSDNNCLNLWQGNQWDEACFCSLTAPVVNSNSPVCGGSSIQLSVPAVNGATYNWTGPNGFTSSLQNPVINNASSTEAGTYSVVIEVNNCVSPTGSTNVTVASQPVANASSNSPICDVNDTLRLMAATVSGATYGWTGPNGFSSSLQNPEITNVSSLIAGDYILTVSANGCNSASDTTTVAYGTSQSGSTNFSYTGSLQTFVVPGCVTQLTIEAWGAQGGDGGSKVGGMGARMRGDFTVTPGETLYVIVGGKGVNDNSGGGGTGAGGGGSGVHRNGAKPMIIAGGGGGSDFQDGGGLGGTTDSCGLAGLSNTNSGGCNGNNGVDITYSGGNTSYGGRGWNAGMNGTLGPNGPTTNGSFGLGGGGGTAGYGICNCGGGGGGYSGGGPGDYNNSGGGGGSYNKGTNQSNSSGVNVGHGKVSFTW